MSFMDGVFDFGDKVLNNGGQVVADALGFIPGVNVVTEGLQSAYHAAHMANDIYDANDDSQSAEYRKHHADEELTQGGEAAWHGGLAALNLVTGEGGAVAGETANLAKAGVEGAEAVAETANVAKAGVEGAEAVGEAASTGGGLMSKAVDFSKGTLEKVQSALPDWVPKIAEDSLPGMLHKTADVAELAVDTGTTIPKMMADDTEKANQIPFLGGLPGMIGNAMFPGLKTQVPEEGAPEAG